MTFGTEWGVGADAETSRAIFDIYANAGGNFIDTANRYTEGTSEKIVADCIAADRAHFVVATKYTLFNRKGDPNAAGNQRKNMIQSLEASLKRLNTEYIDLFWVHAWDFLTAEEEVMRGLDDLIRSGKVFYIGISDTPAWVVARCNTIAELRGWSRFAALQAEYNLLQRTPERDLLPMAAALDLAVTAWAPIAGGALSGKYIQEKPAAGRLTPDSPRLNEKNTAIAQAVVEIAAKINCSPVQVALNWLRSRPQVIIPIIGARTAAQITDSLNCLHQLLPTEDIQRLDQISAIEMGFPHDFLSKEYVQELVYGGCFSLIDNHRKK
jgi:aryl-alcohol dehydrogenase-like predicted oxidoreductase